jgi:hypothetical protein
VRGANLAFASDVAAELEAKLNNSGRSLDDVCRRHVGHLLA